MFLDSIAFTVVNIFGVTRFPFYYICLHSSHVRFQRNHIGVATTRPLDKKTVSQWLLAMVYLSDKIWLVSYVILSGLLPRNCVGQLHFTLTSQELLEIVFNCMQGASGNCENLRGYGHLQEYVAIHTFFSIQYNTCYNSIERYCYTRNAIW